MFGPRTPLAPSLRRSTNRAVGCAFEVDLRLPEASEEDLLQLLEEQIDQREQMINFLENQVREWSGHPSASTWSQPQRDAD